MAVKSLLLFSLGCLWVVEPGEMFACSCDGIEDTFSKFEITEEVDLSNSGAERLLSTRLSFEFESACFCTLADCLHAVSLSHVTHDVQSRGPPTSWL